MFQKLLYSIDSFVRAAFSFHHFFNTINSGAIQVLFKSIKLPFTLINIIKTKKITDYLYGEKTLILFKKLNILNLLENRFLFRFSVIFKNLKNGRFLCLPVQFFLSLCFLSQFSERNLEERPDGLIFICFLFSLQNLSNFRLSFFLRRPFPA